MPSWTAVARDQWPRGRRARAGNGCRTRAEGSAGSEWCRICRADVGSAVAKSVALEAGVVAKNGNTSRARAGRNSRKDRKRDHVRMMLKGRLNGPRRRGDHPALPTTPAELARDAAASAAAGAQALHLHVKDDDGADTLDGKALANIPASRPLLPDSAGTAGQHCPGNRRKRGRSAAVAHRPGPRHSGAPARRGHHLLAGPAIRATPRASDPDRSGGHPDNARRIVRAGQCGPAPRRHPTLRLTHRSAWNQREPKAFASVGTTAPRSGLTRLANASDDAGQTGENNDQGRAGD
ncbi:MAG TPA: 3-keto-5-aminohexanoate cleavage protein [Mycobacteriales bacterium]|nr:3-keto-5-aminohexanoate cleavage protein [Mycobacteriales bacterium]